MRISRTSVGLALGLAGAAAAASRPRQWAKNLDGTDGDPLGLPAGDELVIPTHDGGSLHGMTMGSGETLFVLAHGWTSDHRVWAPVARRLVDRGHRVAVYDQRGHGRSRAGEDGLTVAALGHDLASVLDHLDARDAVVVGHSMGGMAVQKLAIAHRGVLDARAKAIVLLASACAGTAPAALAATFGRVLGSTAIDRHVANPRLARYIFRSSIGVKPSLTTITSIAEAFANTTADTRGRLYLDMAAMDHSEELRTLDIPTWVLCGTRDLVLPLPRSRRLAELIPGAHLEVFPGVGHMVTCEIPDQVTATLERAARAPGRRPAVRA